jgi:hypothetical protein
MSPEHVFGIYLAVQLLALVFLGRKALLWVLAPIPLMAAILITANRAYEGNSNLWPIWILLISPIAILYLLCVVLVTLWRSRGAV